MKQTRMFTSALEGNQDYRLSREQNSWENNMVNVSLEELWALAEAEATKRGAEADYVFGEIGLFLEMPAKYAGYYPTPTNTSTFARTGGDYVHYGLMQVGDALTDASPVVMTLPFSDNHNVVVGESLWDFLCLGCEVGYFGLEQLAYQRQKTLDLLERADHPERFETTMERRDLLAVLTQAFALKPWEAVEARLDLLHQKYHGLLKLSPDE